MPTNCPHSSPAPQAINFQASAKQVHSQHRVRVICSWASFNWQLDFWGKYRRATEAARANLLAARWAREYVISTLVSDVAASYFQLRALDLQLEISSRTLAARKESSEADPDLGDGGASNDA